MSRIISSAVYKVKGTDKVFKEIRYANGGATTTYNVPMMHEYTRRIQQETIEALEGKLLMAQYVTRVDDGD
jgi:hypothetical protein